MNRKFELTSNKRIVKGFNGDITLFQIKALIDFGDVSKNDLGGFIESESNLSEDGDSWIYEGAKVYGKARVYGNAKVYGNAEIYGNAKVFGNAKVYGNASVSGNVFEDAIVCKNAWINGNVFGHAKVYGNASASGYVFGNAKVYGNADISGEAMIHGDSEVFGNSEIDGRVEIHECAKVFGNASVIGDELWNADDDFEIGHLDIFEFVDTYVLAKIEGDSIVATGGQLVTDDIKKFNEKILSLNKPWAIEVSGNAKIYENASISKSLKISGDERVFGNSKINT